MPPYFSSYLTIHCWTQASLRARFHAQSSRPSSSTRDLLPGHWSSGQEVLLRCAYQSPLQNTSTPTPRFYIGLFAISACYIIRLLCFWWHLLEQIVLLQAIHETNARCSRDTVLWTGFDSATRGRTSPASEAASGPSPPTNWLHTTLKVN